MGQGLSPGDTCRGTSRNCTEGAVLKSYEKNEVKWGQYPKCRDSRVKRELERSHPGLTVLAHAFWHPLQSLCVLSAMRLCCFPRQLTPVTVTVSPIGNWKT